VHHRGHDRRGHPDDHRHGRATRADRSSAWASWPGSGAACRAHRHRHHRDAAHRGRRDHPDHHGRPADGVRPDAARRCWSGGEASPGPCPARGRTGCSPDAVRHRNDGDPACHRADRRCHRGADADPADPHRECPERWGGTSRDATDRRCDAAGRHERPARYDADPDADPADRADPAPAVRHRDAAPREREEPTAAGPPAGSVPPGRAAARRAAQPTWPERTVPGPPQPGPRRAGSPASGPAASGSAASVPGRWTVGDRGSPDADPDEPGCRSGRRRSNHRSTGWPGRRIRYPDGTGRAQRVGSANPDATPRCRDPDGRGQRSSLLAWTTHRPSRTSP
jgi:hypothetical protein